MSPESLDTYYKEISAFTDQYFENHLSYMKWDSKKSWSLYGQPVNRLRWGMDPQDVNAYYNPLLNEIVFPAGILQAPFFGLEYPSCMNYGGIGAVMGHELTVSGRQFVYNIDRNWRTDEMESQHAFDDSGRQYAGDGRIASWWTNETVTKFNERAQCFVNQYSNFTVAEANNQSINVNGKVIVVNTLFNND